MNQVVDIQPNLEDKLVIIEPLRANDYSSLYQVASDAEIWEQHPSKDRHTQLCFSKFFAESIDSLGALVIRDKKSGRVIGSSRFKVIDITDRMVEIGWIFWQSSFGEESTIERSKLLW